MSNDTYTIGQAGAVGPHSHAHDMTFQQVRQQSALDLATIAEELARLRAAIRNAADESIERDQSLGAVAAAERAARAGDGPAMLESLKPVGKWLLAFADELKVPAALEAIKVALGAS